MHFCSFKNFSGLSGCKDIWLQSFLSRGSVAIILLHIAPWLQYNDVAHNLMILEQSVIVWAYELWILFGNTSQSIGTLSSIFGGFLSCSKVRNRRARGILHHSRNVGYICRIYLLDLFVGYICWIYLLDIFVEYICWIYFFIYLLDISVGYIWAKYFITGEMLDIFVAAYFQLG